MNTVCCLVMQPTLIPLLHFCTKGNTNPVLLLLFAAPVVRHSQFNVEMTLGNHATAIQPRVRINFIKIVY